MSGFTPKLHNVGVSTHWPELGVVIRRHRISQGLTQEQLAERAGSHWTYVSELENGHRNPGIALLRRLAQSLQTPLATIIAEAERETTPEMDQTT